ncbi:MULTISPECIES: hypothetical protein [Pseudoalteromonas]|nr:MULTISPECIES: hypothetical protein [Pseudoalteromonas]MDI4652946.1 hypothetical protein [Pseudoalteromonas shioyasakiensis]
MDIMYYFALFAKAIDQINYEDTEHYQITKAFLNNPKPMLEELFKPEDD